MVPETALVIPLQGLPSHREGCEGPKVEKPTYESLRHSAQYLHAIQVRTGFANDKMGCGSVCVESW